MVLVKPNNSLVKARIKKIIESRTGSNSLELLILSSEDVGQMANFTKDKIGESIKVFSNEDFSSLRTDETVEAEIRFKGDEFGGKFFASDIREKK